MKFSFLKVVPFVFVLFIFFSCQEFTEVINIPANSPICFSSTSKDSFHNSIYNIYIDENNNSQLDENETLEGNIEYISQNRGIIFTPETPLKEGQIINITIKNLNDDNKSITKKINITAEDTSNPVLETDYSNKKLSVNDPIKLTFDDYINPSSLVHRNIILKNNEGRHVPFRIQYSGKTAYIIFQERTKPETCFNIYLQNIKNISGLSISPISLSLQNCDIDYGLYFYGKYGKVEKYTPGFENEFYNPENPVIIYSHGWQPNKVNKQGGYLTESYLLSDEEFSGNSSLIGTSIFLNHSWINKGWNTAMVHWNQFADEPSEFNQNGTAVKSGVMEAEAKIWSFDGPSGKRYRLNGENRYKDFNNTIQFNVNEITINSAGELLALYVIDALKKNTSGNIRLAGHSLGNQMACSLAKSLYDNDIFINRIALLDPAWSGGEKEYLKTSKYNKYGSWVGEVSRNILFEIQKNTSIDSFVIEIYHTTVLNQYIGAVINLDNPFDIKNASFEGIDNNRPLSTRSVDVHLKPWYFSAEQIAEKHRAARYHYFLSMDFDTNVYDPIEYSRDKTGFFKWEYVPTGRYVPSAATPDVVMHNMMNENCYWEQIFNPFRKDLSFSTKTLIVTDDNFEKKNRWF